MGKKPDYTSGQPAFLEFVKLIVNHPAYQGMPDLYKDDGGVQWAAPSNRLAGKFKDTHIRRLQWWRKKAIEIGIDPNEPEWKSKVAKAIHPTKERPCMVCGRVMDIRYAYPSANLLSRIRKLPYFDESFPLDPLEHIKELVARMVEQFGDRVFNDLPHLLKSNAIPIPKLSPSLEAWLKWIVDSYMPAEPSTLSPGAMANPPDRLDGFHSYNRCCRSTADTGRSKMNLQSYTTDRRVFEYWVEGDWVAADRMMGLIRSQPDIKAAPCANGHPGPCSADHIGPISLGFAHRPEFRLLCKACNSAKNNRMSLADVRDLLAAEKRSDSITSWYAEDLWNSLKARVNSEETALRISKLLRDNRHTLMDLLGTLANKGFFTFLATFLGLSYASNDPEFVGLHIEGHITRFRAIKSIPRKTKYATEQKARRFRVAFDELRDYFKKDNRNAFVIKNAAIAAKVDAAIKALSEVPPDVKALDKRIATVLAQKVPSDELLREIVEQIPSHEAEPKQFREARKLLREAMTLVSKELSNAWNHERYVRITDEDAIL